MRFLKLGWLVFDLGPAKKHRLACGNARRGWHATHLWWRLYLVHTKPRLDHTRPAWVRFLSNYTTARRRLRNRQPAA